MDPKRLIEAALFMSGKEIPISELKKITGIAATGALKNIIKQLNEEYSDKSIEIVDVGEEYIMRVKEEYLPEVEKFAQEKELTNSELRTLSIIASKGPIKKSILANQLGSQIYYDVKTLVSKGFVSEKKEGRSSILKTTTKFKRYFKME